VHRPGPGDRCGDRAALSAVDLKSIVASGYDTIAEQYEQWASAFEPFVLDWVERLLQRLPEGARVLDLGCGNGMVTRVLVERHDVTGVDISAAQLERARRKAPRAAFVHADAAQLVLPQETFDGVVSTFVFGHVPRAEQGVLLDRVHAWLRPGGWLLITLGVGESHDVVVPDWLGAPMFFASWDEAMNLELLRQAGFRVDEQRVVPLDEPGHGRVSFKWVLAQA
jgi:ubiquinone/menaquinone biosynthesis C-methylase UbiE